jgi:hypothetical protein
VTLNALPLAASRRLVNVSFAEHSPPMLLAHFVGDAPAVIAAIVRVDRDYRSHTDRLACPRSLSARRDTD